MNLTFKGIFNLTSETGDKLINSQSKLAINLTKFT